jgi:hypothetical protein
LALTKFLKKITGFDKFWKVVSYKLDSQKILNAKILILEHNKLDTINSLKDIEFSVFSQMGDDGILQWLIHKIQLPEHLKTFIEFGVENYTEATTRFLLINNNWSGLVMDGSEANIQFIKNDFVSWMYELSSRQVFITAENINAEIKAEGFEGEIGLLHIDIDGNDYWVWKAINIINPVLVVVEYNSAFGNERPITIPYDPGFIASEAHYSRVYYGTSLQALLALAKEKNYSFLGCNSAGNNAYFIRNDYFTIVENKIMNKEYVRSKFRQNRLPDGKLSLLNDAQILKTVGKLDVFNVLSSKNEVL